MTTICKNCGSRCDSGICKVCGTPQNITALRNWVIENNAGIIPHNLVIGKESVDPFVCGLYVDESTRDYVVYRTNECGFSRLLYQGQDEATAVYSLFSKLRDDMSRRAMMIYNSGIQAGNVSVVIRTVIFILGIIGIAVLLLCVLRGYL